jgi:hypothetical protein
LHLHFRRDARVKSVNFKSYCIGISGKKSSKLLFLYVTVFCFEIYFFFCVLLYFVVRSGWDCSAAQQSAPLWFLVSHLDSSFHQPPFIHKASGFCGVFICDPNIITRIIISSVTTIHTITTHIPHCYVVLIM